VNISEQIRLFIEPKSIAIIGASRSTGQGSLNMVENLLSFGYQGKIFPVNPKATEILGIKTYPNAKDIPDHVDLAVIITPRLQTIDAVRDCAQKGIKALVVIGQGFADGNDEGKEMQAQMVKIAREAGSRIMGPNTLGVINCFTHLNASLALFEKVEKAPVAIISQTGVFCLTYPRFPYLGKIFDIGNASDIGWADILEYLENDPDTKVIFLYTEGIPGGRRFLDVARRVTRKKPIVAIKTGVSETAKRAVASHTGSLAGEDAIYEAAFRQAGIIRAKDLEESHDIAKALLFLPLMKGRRVGIVTTTGAGGIMATDACDAVNLEIATLSGKTRQKLEAVYPLWMSVENPCDIWPAASIMRHGLDNVYAMTLEALIEDENVDAVACLCIAVNYGWGQFNIPGVIKDVAKKSDKPIIAWFFGPDMEEERTKVEMGGNVVAYPTVDRGMRALAALHSYAAIAQGKRRDYERILIENGKVKDLFAGARKNNRVNVGLEALEVLRACNITIPNYRIAETENEAATVAEDIGYPIVIKSVAADVLHKTEVGGVLTGIDSSPRVIAAYQRILENIKKNGLSEKISGVLIQKMIEGGKEVIIGMKRDEHFGPVMMFGMGGIYTEVLKDVSFRIAPLSREDAREMISEVKGYELLKGVRGEDPSDISAIGDTLLKVSQLAVDFPEIMEMDINPFIVLAEGKGGVGVDARVRLEKEK